MAGSRCHHHRCRACCFFLDLQSWTVLSCYSAAPHPESSETGFCPHTPGRLRCFFLDPQNGTFNSNTVYLGQADQGRFEYFSRVSERAGLTAGPAPALSSAAGAAGEEAACRDKAHACCPVPAASGTLPCPPTCRSPRPRPIPAPAVRAGVPAAHAAPARHPALPRLVLRRRGQVLLDRVPQLRALEAQSGACCYFQLFCAISSCYV